MSKVYGGLVSSPYNKLDTIGHFSVTHTFDGKTIDGGVEEPATIILTTFPESIGAVSGDGIFFKGSSVTVVATPDLESEYPVFVGWYNGDTKVSSNASYTFTVNSTSTLVAKFEEVKYDITLQKDPASTGTVTGGGRFVVGASVTVVATPDSESEYPEFDGWYENDTKVSENVSYTFTVSGARTLVAKFKEVTDPTVIDLGLPSGRKWRSMNLGANHPEDNGLYYSWGNVQGHTYSEGYEWGEGIPDGTTDQYKQTTGATLTGNIPTNVTYDAAVAALGSPWRMPTKADFEELIDSSNCTKEWTTLNAINGYLFTSVRNGNTLFLPVTGQGYGSSIESEYEIGNYWSSSLDYGDYAFSLFFGSSNVYTSSDGADSGRYFGYAIRPVQ